MRAIFVMVKCEMGQAYRVAREMADNIPELSEMHSTSGQYDLLGKFYLEPDQDIGLFVVERIQTVAGGEGHLHPADLQRLLRRQGLRPAGPPRRPTGPRSRPGCLQSRPALRRGASPYLDDGGSTPCAFCPF